MLSIIIPVFERQTQLNQLLNDLFGQILQYQYESLIELIVVDDASAVAISVPSSPVSLKLVRNKVNVGAPLSRSKGLSHATGKYVHFHDSDDSIADNWLFEVVKTLKASPDTDILMTGRVDVASNSKQIRVQKYFHQQSDNPHKINSRLVYRNCMGPLGGVTFSKKMLDKITFKAFASCQDWQMYIDALQHAKVLRSRPEIQFIFNQTGDDRISHNPRKKILGHLQLAKLTAPKSPFGRHIRLFYLYTCKQHIFNKGGYVLKFYKKHQLKIFFTFLVVSVFWRLT